MDKFIPKIYKKSILDIDYKELKKKNIKCLLFDLDNTLLEIKQSSPKKEIGLLVKKLKKDFKVIIISNSSKDRVRPFKEKLNVDSSFRSYKPLKKKYKKIMNVYNFKDTEIACIGDMLLTDIYGGNRMGFTTILVNNISEMEPFYVRMLRRIERKIIKKLNKKDLLIKGVYYE